MIVGGKTMPICTSIFLSLFFQTLFFKGKYNGQASEYEISEKLF